MAEGQMKVLVLGAGLVTPPLISYLSKHNFFVIVANRTLKHAQKIIAGFSNTEAVEVDVEKPDSFKKLDELVPKVDAVVSMLPYLFHAAAAKMAIKYKKHFFTTSYVSDAMRELEPSAKEAGIVMINECGVDPGTDHMSAMRIIHALKAKGGKVMGFSSFCGGLPAPDANDNPFGYKLSWAPRGVLLASRNPAHYLKNGQDVNIAGKDLFDNYEVVDIPGVGKFEAYPNRNSAQYLQIYGIEEAQSIIRGTYRNIGWCPTIKKIADLGYLDLDKQDFGGKTYLQLAQAKVGSTSDIKEVVAKQLGLTADHRIVTSMEWLGLFSDEKVPEDVNTYLDALCHLCKEKLVYKPGERDMIVMKHDFEVEYPEGKKEHITCTLVDYGISNGDTSMSRTVSLPVAIAVRLVLEGKVKLSPGLNVPTIPELYNPILDELEQLGIKFVDRAEPRA